MAAPMAKCLLSTFFNTQMQNLRQITRVTTQVRQCMVATGPLSRQFSGISGCHVVKPSKYHFSLAHHVTLLAGERSTAGTSLSLQSQRSFASESGLDDAAVKSRMEDIADKFMEARDLLEDAREVKGTVYFSEDMKEAAEAVDETLKDYNDFLAQLDDKQRQVVLRTIGLKMEELRAHKDMLVDELLED